MLKRLINGIRSFFKSMGLVEQAQVVASTAIVVVMITIITARIILRENLGPLDFISVVTVGVIGYVCIVFVLKYGRMLEAQRRELLELNTIAEAVNHSVELMYVLESALIKVAELMQADTGWIYLDENQTLVLKHRYGTNAELFPPGLPTDEGALSWILAPGLHHADHNTVLYSTTNEFREEGIKILASIPLIRQGTFAGVLIIGSKDVKRFEVKKIAVIQAFGNNISMALNNAFLFEQVKKSEQQYADLYEHSPDMYHSVNRDGIIVSCNLTESRLLGLPKEKIIGHPLLGLYPPSQQDQVRTNLQKIFV
jgi:PAS domain-containing protein